jgi:hypothetical protein
MIIYKDIFHESDELLSDTYKIKIVDDIILEVDGKTITCKPGDTSGVDIGGNASAEGGGDDVEDADTVTGCNIVLAHRLSATGFDKKGWTVYIKDYMKRILKKLEESDPDRAKVFKANAPGVVKKILGSFKDWEMFTGESMDPEGSLVYMNYREDGMTPYLWFFKDGLLEEKV